MNHPSHESFAALAAGNHYAELEREAIRQEILAERAAAASAVLEREIDARLAERRGTAANAEQGTAIA
jgi:hypothetical protein